MSVERGDRRGHAWWPMAAIVLLGVTCIVAGMQSRAEAIEPLEPGASVEGSAGAAVPVPEPAGDDAEVSEGRPSEAEPDPDEREEPDLDERELPDLDERELPDLDERELPDPATDERPLEAPGGSPSPRTSGAPALASTTIPIGSILLAAIVLIVAFTTALVVKQRQDDALVPASEPAAGSPRLGSKTVPGELLSPAATKETLDFVLELGAALIDTGDAVTHVQTSLQRVAETNGIREVGIVVLPTALIISLPGAGGVQTDVSPAGTTSLRLDQVAAIVRTAEAAQRGELTPTEGRRALAEARDLVPAHGSAVRLVGHMLFTAGLVLILRGGAADLVVAVALGLIVGSLQILVQRLGPGYGSFFPVVAGFLSSVVVFGLGRVVPELSVFPPLVAPLVTLLPGALLTVAVFELSTGQIISGAGRLASGALQLVLLALGILAGAQLIGVPAAAIDAPLTDPFSVLLPWIGVGMFGWGVMLFNGVRGSALPWMLLVLYVAYAGQVLGGLVFGSALSAFAGALLMTPAALLAARQPAGVPALVSFLPGFWLLVPGAVGLAGVTRFLDEDRIEGVSSLVTMGTSMVGIALGVLLGLAIGTEIAARSGGPQSAG